VQKVKFADDTKLFGKIRGTSDVIKLQDDLDQLLESSGRGEKRKALDDEIEE